MASLMPWRRREGGLAAWDPFRELEEMHDRMGRMLDTAFGPPTAGVGWSPMVDIEETQDAWVLHAELPGVRREDINIELRQGELAITGERKEEERQGALRRQMRRTGRFDYRVQLPGEVDVNRIEASLSQGVLTVRVPKAPEAQPRRIEVRATEAPAVTSGDGGGRR